MTHCPPTADARPCDELPLGHLDVLDLRDALKQASAAILESEDRERRRMATELHDSTGQHLAGASMILARVEKCASHDVRRSLHEARDAVDAALEEIRTLSYLLHPPQLARDGLPASLQTLASGFGRRSGLQVQFACDGVPRPLEPAVELAIFRIAQEALLNAHKHARASAAALRLNYRVLGVRLEITDDGEVVVAPNLTSGVGLSSMRTRMRELGGRLEVARRGAGLVVIATAPTADSAAAAERAQPRSARSRMATHGARAMANSNGASSRRQAAIESEPFGAGAKAGAQSIGLSGRRDQPEMLLIQPITSDERRKRALSVWRGLTRAPRSAVRSQRAMASRHAQSEMPYPSRAVQVTVTGGPPPLAVIGTTTRPGPNGDRDQTNVATDPNAA